MNLRSYVVGLLLLGLPPAAAAAQDFLIMGPGAGSSPTVAGYPFIENGLNSFLAYNPSFTGGVRVALGDVDGDGWVDLITAPGSGGGPLVKVYRHGISLLASFYAYSPSFGGGVFVAAGDVNGDGHDDIITGAGAGGGPHVEVFSGADLSLLASFYAYNPSFTGGVHVAAGDVNGDGYADIITGAGPGGGPHVEVFSGADLSVLASFYAYAPSFSGGVFVASGDFDTDGRADIVTGAGPGGGPHVRILSGADLSELASFYAYHPAFTGGVTVGVWYDMSTDPIRPPIPLLVTGAGPGGGPQVQVFSTKLSLLQSFYAFDPSFSGGVFVASLPGKDAALKIRSSATTTFTVGSLGQFTVFTEGLGDGGNVTFTETGTLPAGVTFRNAGIVGVLEGTPAAGTGGTYPLVFTATDRYGRSATQAFTLIVR